MMTPTSTPTGGEPAASETLDDPDSDLEAEPGPVTAFLPMRASCRGQRSWPEVDHHA